MVGKKWHVKADGTMGECTARDGNCPFQNENGTRHFTREKDARAYSEERIKAVETGRKLGTNLKRSSKASDDTIQSKVSSHTKEAYGIDPWVNDDEQHRLAGDSTSVYLNDKNTSKAAMHGNTSGGRREQAPQDNPPVPKRRMKTVSALRDDLACYDDSFPINIMDPETRQLFSLITAGPYDMNEEASADNPIVLERYDANDPAFQEFKWAPSMTVRELKSILSKADDTAPVVIYDPESGSNFPITQIGKSLENGSLALGYSEWI